MPVVGTKKMDEESARKIEAKVEQHIAVLIRNFIDEGTTQLLDKIFEGKLLISLTAFVRHTGLNRSTVEDYIDTGTIRAIRSGTHVYISRPMAIAFLLKGGGTREYPTAPPLTLSALDRAALRHKREHQKRRTRHNGILRKK